MGGPWEKYAGMGQPSQALPQAGDPTSFSGGSSAGVVTPQRYDPGTLDAFTLDLMANGGKGAAGILNNDPGQQYARSYATTQAANQAGLDFKQKMTAKMLDTLHRFRQIGTEAGPDVLSEAIGPDYSGGSSWNPLPDTSGEAYQNARAFLRGDSDGQDVYSKARDTNLQMQHLVKGIGAGVKAIPGTKGGGTSTDADQALVLDAVGEAMHASNPETHFKILFDAENILRARAGMQPLPTPKSYLPDSWQKPQTADGPANGAADAPARKFTYLGKVQ